MATLLQVRNLTTQFFTSSGTVRAVDNITFHVDEGETVAVVGESGCGKSVSALSILRLVPWPPGKIVGGSINFMGQNLLEMGDEDIRRIRAAVNGRKADLHEADRFLAGRPAGRHGSGHRPGR